MFQVLAECILRGVASSGSLTEKSATEFCSGDQPALSLWKNPKSMKRRVFVTGGAHGIGKGIVEAFARQGDEVVFCDLDPVLGTQTAAETGAQFCQLDVTDAVSLERCMRELFDTWGDIDILVNNVGISPFKPLTELSIEEFDRVIATNLRPVFITPASWCSTASRTATVATAASSTSARPATCRARPEPKPTPLRRAASTR